MVSQGNTERDLVYTIKDRCRVCYTCVRECPVKAIKIINGQAEVIQERCIACGNCTRVCSQGAKAFLSTWKNVRNMLRGKKKTYAMIAPSFISEFDDVSIPAFLSMVRELGFDGVYEVAFGADLVAGKYRALIKKNDTKGYISSDCPAIVSYIEKYYPELTSCLAPVVSPMVATARFLRKMLGNQVNLVFIGPCIAKKAEPGEVDEQITFIELREMFSEAGINPALTGESKFDAPAGGKGAIFPVSRGLLQTVNLPEEEIERNVIVAEGRVDFQEAIREYESGSLDSEHLELLCCEGCIMGPGSSANGKKFERRARVMNYVRDKLSQFDVNSWSEAVDSAQTLDLSRTFTPRDSRIPDPSEERVREILRRMNKHNEKDHLNCGACGYDTCRNHAIAITKGLAEIEMCLPYSIEKLHNSIDDLAISNEKLLSVQQALRQTEKLAHMGQLSAGIAHELNNPLGVVIMYANILLEEAGDGSEYHDDLHLIVEQAERCKTIVAGLLNFARKNQVNYRETELPELIRRSISSLVIPKGIELKIHQELKDPFAELDDEQMVQVLSNLLRNAVEAMPGGGEVNVELLDNEHFVKIIIKDTGTGIHESDLQKVFEPFFTTKGIGRGTGLGLATAYGVVKMHKGSIEVESNADPGKGPTYTRFLIKLPRRSPI